MATTALITGRVLLPDNTPPVDGIVKFVLSGMDTDDAEVIAPYQVSFALEADGDLPAGCAVYVNAEGLRGTLYTVYVFHALLDTFGGAAQYVERKLGVIQITGEGPHTLSSLINAGAVAVPTSWFRTITEDQYNAAIQAVEDAQDAAAAAEESASAAAISVATLNTATNDAQNQAASAASSAAAASNSLIALGDALVNGLGAFSVDANGDLNVTYNSSIITAISINATTGDLSITYGV
jgi:hypothetical protein